MVRLANELNNYVDFDIEPVYTDTIVLLEELFPDSSAVLYVVHGDYMRLVSKTKSYNVDGIKSQLVRDWEYVDTSKREDDLYVNVSHDVTKASVAKYIYDDAGKKVALVSLFDVVEEDDFEDSLFIFNIITSFLRFVLLTSKRYKRLIDHHKYIGNTKILTPTEYKTVYNEILDRKEKQEVEYLLLRLHKHTELDLISHVVFPLIRDEDYLGYDGEYVYVILTNASRENFDALFLRFDAKGITFDVLEGDFYEPTI
jgi:hypothetical protein